MNELAQQDLIVRIQKRDGRVETFKPQKITAAIQKAGEATGEFTVEEARRLALKVVTLIHSLQDTLSLSVENVQDIVEEVLLASPYRRTALTAERIAAELDTVHYPEVAIREIVKRAENMVGFRGLTLDALRAEFGRVAPDATLPHPWWTPHAEDDAAVLARVAPFLERLLERREGDVLLVGHGASVGAATRFFLARCAPVPEEMPLSWNCALTAFRVGEPCETLLIRDTTHLADEEVTSNAKTKLEVEGTPVPAGEAVVDEPDASVEGGG